MAGKWHDKPLSELCTYITRGAAPAYLKTGGILVLNQKCVRDQRVSFAEARRTDHMRKPVSRQRMLQPLDIVVNSTGVGTLGRVAQIRSLPEPSTIDSHVTVVRPDPEAINARYLGYAVRYLEPEIEALGEGSTGQTELARHRLADFRVPVPPRNEQAAIAHILGTLDDKIELNRRMSETLEAMVRAIFKSWFVDFDPVRAKANGRDSGLPKPLADLFPDCLVNSELGAIPEGWHIETLADHCNAVKGVSYKGSGLSGSGMPLHNLNSIYEGGGYKYEGIKFYTGDYAERHVVHPGDVIVANTEQGHERLLIGYAAMVPTLFGALGIVSHHVYRLRPKRESSLTAAFLCWLLNSPLMHDIVSGYANGTTVNMLPIDAMQKPAIVCPPASLVAAFDSVAANADRRREEMVSESRTLAALRETFLPKLISGELRVNEVGRVLEKVSA